MCNLEKVIYSSFIKYQQLSGPAMLHTKQQWDRESLTHSYTQHSLNLSTEKSFWETKLFVQCYT